MAHIKYPLQHTFLDYPDNSSDAIVIFFYGCSIQCKNCHNLEMQKNNLGQEFYIKELIEEIKKACRRYKTNCIVLSGGNPIDKHNLLATRVILHELGKKYKIAIYTGYDIGYVKSKKLKGFKFIKCGRYDESLKQEPCKTDRYFKLASINQNWYDKNYNQISQDGILYFNN